MPLSSFDSNNPYRRFIERAKQPIFFDYGGYPAPASTPAPQLGANVSSLTQGNPTDVTPDRVMRPQLPTSLDGGAVSSGIGSGVSGQGAASGGVSASPSSIGGTGIGSIASNIGIGGVQGMIAAAMGLASMAPAVGTISSIASLANSMGIQGLTNGIAVSNDQSSNNAVNDANAIAAVANEQGIGPNSAGPVGPDAAASSPGNSAAATGVADSSVGSPGGESGSTYARGGQAYQRFKDGGRPIRKPQHNNFEGIYDDPRDIADDARGMTAPEDPAMKQLFGIDRAGMYERFKDRAGNISGRELIPMYDNGRGAAAAKNIMTPRNEQRLIDILTEADKRAPEMSRGMHSWYALDPIHERLAELHGPDMADNLFRKFNTFLGMSSPRATVPHEIARGTAANTLNNSGRFDDFAKYVAVPSEERAGMSMFPPDLMHVPGSIAHTAQVGPIRNFIGSDEVNMTKPKVPLYIGASSHPSLGFQSDFPVPDSHFSRGIGLADTRTSQANPSSSMSMPEISDVAPWFRSKIAEPLGIEAVPAQARLWGTLAKATGVQSPVGAPKLELIAKHIMDRAGKLGRNPFDLRDDIISGQAFGGGGRVDHRPVPRSMGHLYRQFTKQQLTPPHSH